MPRYAVRQVASVARDFAVIRHHLVESYRVLGDSRQSAVERARKRIDGAYEYMASFADHPHRGTVHPDLDGTRHVTEADFVYYFDVDDASCEVSVRAVFFSGQNHAVQIRERLG